tara:strand:+ start:1208 stop:2218 length:1011 start_codon:yes stop_codon:yes gene_type:complete
MEDYNSNLLNDSKNEWSIRLMNILCGHVIDGFRSIFNESIELCEKNEEPEKYLMTFQNFLSRIPKWNQTMISQECERIKETSKCAYLEDLMTCVHIIQLKILSCVRTSNQVKKIDIDIPSLENFLHHVYINIARKLYSNIYLFQVDVTPLEQQKNNREFENIVQACIMNTIRDNIPIDTLLRQYMDETQEEGYVREVPPKVEESSNTGGDSSANDTNTEPVVSMPPSNVEFENVVEKYDPVNEEKTQETINFEAKPEPEPESMSDDIDENENENEERLTIGDTIQMELGEDLEPKKEPRVDEIVPVELDSFGFDEPTPPSAPIEDVIDLGVEEIKL